MNHHWRYGHWPNWTYDTFYGRWCLTCYYYHVKARALGKIRR